MKSNISINYQVHHEDWHIYNPVKDEVVNVTQPAPSFSRKDIVGFQNQFRKLLELWRASLEALFSVSFVVTGFQFDQLSFKDYFSMENHIIYSIREKDMFFSIYIEDRIAKYLINQSFGVTELAVDKLSFSDMEQLFFSQLFQDLFIPLFGKTGIISGQPDYEFIYGKKEKNTLINDSETYYLFTFHMQLPNIHEKTKVIFALTKKNLEQFMSRLKFPGESFSRIILNPMVQKKFNTEVDVIFDEVTINLSELQALRGGDVLLTGKKIGDQVEVIIGNDLKFSALPGIINGKMGVQLKHKLADNSKKEDNIEEKLTLSMSDDQNSEDEEWFEKSEEEEADSQDEAFVSKLDEEDNSENEFDWENV
ncbi:MAG: FliM/FliN family flagellar motor C-terminal domain-containing protein [Candidatus Margulisbacteria bacterium]|nr:FliM/FliN family flagellar motor C-terminal domain-containing protein [Candidatus Margulisiibacteriota bacterium]